MPQTKPSLQELHEASDRGIVVVNLTMYVRKVNMGGYATGNALAHAGVIIGGADMTVEATLTKLHYLLSQNWILKPSARP